MENAQEQKELPATEEILSCGWQVFYGYSLKMPLIMLNASSLRTAN